MLDESDRLGAVGAGRNASGMCCDRGALSSRLCTLRETSARVALRAGSAAGGCSLPQGPHTAVLDQRQVTDPDAGDMQAFMLRRVPCPVMYSPCKSSISEVLKHVTSTLLVPHSWLDSLQSGPH